MVTTIQVWSDMKTAKSEEARAAQFDSFISAMKKERPGEVLRLDDDNMDMEIVCIPTGAISLDVAIGRGGFPRGRIIELFGPEMSGKTSLALSVAAQCQKAGGKVGFIDAEHALDRKHAIDMGVDPHSIVIYQPSSGEDAIDMVDKMIESKGFDMVIVDSVAALTPQAELDGEIGDHQMALHARLMSKWMRRISEPVAKTDTMLVLINQIRKDLQSYGAPDTTTGGRAIKFQASLRIEIRSAQGKKIVGANKEVIGQTCVATVKKNKIGSPYKVAEYDLIFGKGIQAGGSLLEVCVPLGIITRTGSSYTEVATGLRIAIGKDAAKVAIDSDPEMAARLEAAVYAALRAIPDEASLVSADDPESASDEIDDELLLSE